MHHTHSHSHGHGDGHNHSHSHGGGQSTDDGFSRNRNNPSPPGLNGGIGNGGMVPIDIEDPAKGTVSNEPPPLPKVKVLCIDMTKFSPISQLSLLSAGVFFFFMLNGFIEEYTFAFLDDFKFGWYMTFYELLCFGGFAVAERLTTHEKILDHNAPLDRHLMIAVAMTAARGLTNVSLQYLNYPTQVIFKSMKLVTVMIGSVFCLSKSFAPREYASALLLVTSAVFFSLGDFSFGGASSDTSSKTDMMGIIIVSLSLVADAAHSNTQEYVLQTNKATILETMLFTNVFSAVLCFFYILYTGEFFAAIAYCSERPITYFIFIIRSFVIYCGVLCFASLVKRFDVVVATTVTTVRKILTIVCSFILFPKAFSMNYIYGTIAFLLSIYVGMKPKQTR